MKISPLAGKPAPLGILVDVPRLVTAYYTGIPDPSVPEQRVAFGTSGHRGSSFNVAFNEWHILAITQAICLHRKRQNISGPLYLVIDTHALSIPAWQLLMPVLDVWQATAPSDFPNYAAGTWGPENTQGLLAPGHRWPLPTELLATGKHKRKNS